MPESTKDEILKVFQTIHRHLENQRKRGTEKKEEQILRHLVENWTTDRAIAKRQLSAESIATHVLGRSDDVVAVSNVRAYMTRLRDDLDEFFRYVPAGRHCANRIQVPNGAPYVLLLAQNVQKLDAAERFWDAHIINGIDNWVIHTEPIVFFDAEHRAYIRYLDINVDSLDEQVVAEAIRKVRVDHELCT